MTMHRHEKVIRDPVHDVIAFQLADEADRLVFELLQCREVQRLRRIRQLGFASLAYPGADHSRYSHSLGVFATARQILDRLERDAFHLPPGDRSATLAAALLHDLGHGPFSHVFERVSGIHHEGVTRRLILDDTTDVHRTLIRFETTLPERVVALLECRGHPLACDVLSSQLDADRLDYLLRDNLMTGSRYGRYDLAWLIQAMTVAERRLAIRRKGVSAAEAYLQARYHMYRHVYFHKVVRSAEGMVTLALRRARQLMLDPPRGDVAGVNVALPPGSGSVAKVLRGDRLEAGEFGDLDDVSVLSCFKAWRDGGDAALARLSAGLLDRRLFKTIDLADVDAPEAAGQAVVDQLGETNAFYDSAANRSYEPGPAGIRVEGGVDLAEASPLVRSLANLGDEDRFHRLHVDAEHIDTAVDHLNRSK